MTPQERQLVDELFDRLAPLERAPRDPDAERAIDDGLSRAPNAIYALVQTVLVQDEALKRADARIRELSGEEEAPRSGGSFLDTMRSALGGRSGSTSVPSVGAGAQNAPDPRWNTGGAYPSANQGAQYGGQPGAAPYGAPPGAAPYGAAPSAGGSFLGTAAASAAGAIGGALLFNSIGSLFGRHEGGSAFGGISNAGGSPGDNSASRSDLAREAGLNDVGDKGRDQQAGLLDNGKNDDNDDPDFDSDPGGDVDAGDFDSDDFDGGDDTDTA